MVLLTGVFSGDGKTDVMKVDVPAPGTSNGGRWVVLSDGTKFTTSQWASWQTNQQMNVLLGDFTARRTSDLMKIDVPTSGTSNGGLWVGLSDGTQFITSQW